MVAVYLFTSQIYFLYSILFKGSRDFEFLVISLSSCKFLFHSPDLNLAPFYRPPNSSITLLDTLFSTLCNLNTAVYVNICIIGDFNIDFSSPTPNYLSSKLMSFHLSQIVSEPTRIVSNSSTLIDLAFVSFSSMVNLCETLPSLANSDHLEIHLTTPKKDMEM